METDLMASLHANLTPPGAASAPPAMPGPPAAPPEPDLPAHLKAWVDAQPAEHRQEAIKRAVESLNPTAPPENPKLEPTPTSADTPVEEKKEEDNPAPKKRGRPRKAAVDTGAMGVLLACAAGGQTVATTREFLALAEEISS